MSTIEPAPDLGPITHYVVRNERVQIARGVNAMRPMRAR